MKALLLSALLMGSLFDPPIPLPPVPTQPPIGPLPWPVPAFPFVQADAPVLELSPIEHSEGYEDSVEYVGATWTPLIENVQGATDSAGEWLGEGGYVPETGGDPDFDTGLSGIESTEAFVDELGGNIGILWAYARGLYLAMANMPLGSQLLVGTILLCTTWFIFLNLVTFAIQIFSFVYNLVMHLIDILGPLIEKLGLLLAA